MGKVTRAEWKWVWIIALVLAAALLLPYLVAYQSQGEAWRFSGSLFGVADGNSYLAKMRQGEEGAWLYRLAYTSEPQTGALIFLPYLLLGKLAGGAGLHEQLVALFHLARIAAGIAMILAAYRFLACFIRSVAMRRFALLLAALGGGFGWVLVLLGVMPLEFYSPETFGFLALLGPPHLAAARALLLFALTAIIDPSVLPVPPRWTGATVGGILLALWLFQPLDVPIAWAVSIAYVALMFIQRRSRPGPVRDSEAWAAAQRVLSAVLVSAPAVLYSVIAFNLDPILRQWTAQNIISSPPPWMYLAAYGVLIVPALVGAWLERRDTRLVLPIGWIILLPFLIYFPMNLQRRLADGGLMALVVLATLFLEKLGKARVRLSLVVLVAVLALPSSALFYAGALSQSLHPSSPVFLSVDEVRVLKWLDARAEPGSVVASNFMAGNALPAYTDLIPFIGHGPETLFLGKKEILVEAIFDGGATEAERLEALQKTGARFVLSGPEEQARQGGQIPGCILIHREGGWEVWEVVIKSQ